MITVVEDFPHEQDRASLDDAFRLANTGEEGVELVAGGRTLTGDHPCAIPELRQTDIVPARQWMMVSGHDVVSFDNGKSAYERLREEPFALLLTDIVMPEMDGIELARRATQLDPDLKVMFITGFAAVALNPDSNAPKDAKVLSKPFHLKDLVQEVERMLADIEHVLALEPRHWGALSGLAIIQRHLDQKEKALATFRSVLQIHPGLESARKAIEELEKELDGEPI